MSMDDWRVAETANEVRFRDFNEWIKASNRRMGSQRATHEYICECSDASCRQVIELSDQEYEGIRGDSARFVIALNHENPEIDAVVAQNGRFTTVETLPGSAERIARASDPRRDDRLDAT
jgi:hypothetical protein